MRAKLIFLTIAIVAAFFILVIRKSDGQEQDLYHGVVEAREYSLGFEIPGRLEKVEVYEGDRVVSGQALAQLDLTEFKDGLRASRAEVQAANARLIALRRGTRVEEIAEARARVQRARADLERLSNGATAEEAAQSRARKEEAYRNWQLFSSGSRREDIAKAASELEGLRSELELASAERKRYQALYSAGAIAASTFDQYRTREEESKARFQALSQQHEKLKSGFRAEEVEAAHQRYLQQQASYAELVRGPRPELIKAAAAEVEGAQQRLDLLVAGPRIEDIEIAHQNLVAAQARMKIASKNLEKASLHSPVQGYVQKRNFEPGEAVLPGSQVLSLTNLEDIWVELFIPETEVGQIKLGQKFIVTTDSRGQESYTATVTQISDRAEYTPKQIQTQQQRVFMVYRIRLAVSNVDGHLKPGMPVDARVSSAAAVQGGSTG